MLAGSGAYAQTNGIGGTVTDNAGEPIIGASVKVKGSTNMGTVTDIDGNFKLDVKPGETLIISYIGCKDQEVKAGENLKIVLQDNSEVLGEVVVTGYQVQRKADLTGSVSVVSTKDLKSSADTDPMRSLQGKVPGMTITPTVRQLAPVRFAFVVSVRSILLKILSLLSTVCLPPQPSTRST